MEDLSSRYPMLLAPGSMSGSNTISDHPESALTAPGSTAVNPVPNVLDNVVPVLGGVTSKYRDAILVRRS